MTGQHNLHGGFSNLFHDDNYVKALLEIAGANAYTRKDAYASKLEAAVEKFCGNSCLKEQEQAIVQAVHEEAHAGPHWYRLYPPIRCRPPQNAASACVAAEDGGYWWPEQARLTERQLFAFNETLLDKTVRDFLNKIDTSQIHGVPMVPGHGRWPPREGFPFRSP